MSQQGFALPFPALTLHALTPAGGFLPAHIYCQIDEGDATDEDEYTAMAEMRIFVEETQCECRGEAGMCRGGWEEGGGRWEEGVRRVRGWSFLGRCWPGVCAGGKHTGGESWSRLAWGQRYAASLYRCLT